jgi:hypothetical protein
MPCAGCWPGRLPSRFLRLYRLRKPQRFARCDLRKRAAYIAGMWRPHFGDQTTSLRSSTSYWRKIYTSRQAHSKLKKLASHAKRSQDVPVNLFLKIDKRQSS